MNQSRLPLKYSCIAGVVLWFMFVAQAWAQQAPQYTLFMVNNLVINPAYTGSDEVLSLTVVGRSQWSGVEQSPSTQSFSAHALIRNQHSGAGLTIIRDEIGVHKNTNATASYSYRLQLKTESFLSMGLQVGLTNLKSDYPSLTGGNSGDPKLSSSINENLLDFGAGIYYKGKKFKAGISTPNLRSRTVQINDSSSVTFKRMQFLATGKYCLKLNDVLDLEPAILIKYFPDLPVSYDINASLSYKKVLSAGLSYRKSESIALLLNFRLASQLRFGYAFDYPIQDAVRLATASHEIMLNYLFKTIRNDVVSPR